jgi:putative heme degradation protein
MMSTAPVVRATWSELREVRRSLRAVDLAQQHLVPEAVLLLGARGRDAPVRVRSLRLDVPALLGHLPSFGVVRIVTRNRHAMIEAEGRSSMAWP